MEKDFPDSQWVPIRHARLFLDRTESSEQKWLREVFYMSIDHVTQGLQERFSESHAIFEAFSVFSPSGFGSFTDLYPSVHCVQQSIKSFCQLYGIDLYRCANELYSFASVFHKFKIVPVADESKEDFSSVIESGEVMETETKQHTFIDCLKLLTNQTYKLVDAYPTLCRAYGIAVAIPATSCTA